MKNIPLTNHSFRGSVYQTQQQFFNEQQYIILELSLGVAWVTEHFMWVLKEQPIWVNHLNLMTFLATLHIGFLGEWIKGSVLCQSALKG